MTASLLFTRNAWSDKLIRVGTGDDAGHVGIGLGADHVIDTTLAHGCKLWGRAEWLSHRTLVDEIEVPAASPAHADAAEAYARWAARENWQYDWLEIVGFVLMRDLGDPARGVCSSLARVFFETRTGHHLRTRTGRTSPRHMRIAAGAYLAGRSVSF